MTLFLVGSTGCSAINRVSYIKPVIPEMPVKPVFYDVKWGQGDYCLDERNAKNMLKNKALIDDYTRQLEAIIEGMR